MGSEDGKIFFNQQFGMRVYTKFAVTMELEL
jgi:hypothetical protein